MSKKSRKANPKVKESKDIKEEESKDLKEEESNDIKEEESKDLKEEEESMEIKLKESKGMEEKDNNDIAKKQSKKIKLKGRKNVKKTKENGDVEDNEEYEVEQVVDMDIKLKRKCPIKFRVRWSGYGERDDSWLLLTELSCEHLISDFLEVSGRKSEYEKALESKNVQKEMVRNVRGNARKNYTELPEFEDEILPSGTRTRKIKRSNPFNKKSPSPKKVKTDSSSDSEYEVEEIVGKRYSKGKVQFKVRWRGYAPKYDSWADKKDLSCSQLIKKYDEHLEGDEEKEWKVEHILKMRIKAGKTEYLVHWKGYQSNSDTWEPEENVGGCDQLSEFLKNKEIVTKKTPAKKMISKVPAVAPIERTLKGRKSPRNRV